MFLHILMIFMISFQIWIYFWIRMEYFLHSSPMQEIYSKKINLIQFITNIYLILRTNRFIIFSTTIHLLRYLKLKILKFMVEVCASISERGITYLIIFRIM